MADKEWLKLKSRVVGQDHRVWGRSGIEVRDKIQSELGVNLGEEISIFVDSVGNVSIGPFMVSVAGGEGGALGAIEQTKSLREIEPGLPRSYVQVMDQAGERYFYDSQDGSVVAFDSLNLDSTMKTQFFRGFDEFLEWAFDESKNQASDDRFAF